VLAALAACGDSSSDTASTDSLASNSASSNGAISLVALSSAAYTAAATSATAVITVKRSGASTGEAVVDYTTVNETAIAGADYSQTSGALTWGDGDSSPKAISVPVTAAGVGKEFAVTLVSISGAAQLGTPTSATVVISNSGSDDDSSGSGSSNSSGSNIPAVAAAVGYKTQTFGPAVKLNANWVPWNLYGAGAQPAGAVSQNSDGSLFVSGLENNHYGATVATASQSKGGKGWTGTAFGGGAYFEAVLSFTGQDNGPYNNGGPAFWALDVEHTSQGPYAVGWPGMPKDSSGKIYNDFFEVDFMEYDVKEYSYQNGIGNWYGYPSAGHSTSNPYEAVRGVAGSVLVPTGTDFSQYHKYGCLWVPATPSTRGYLKFYFDDRQIGVTFYWNYYNPNDVSTYPAAPPVNGSTAMSGMDWRHMLLILGTGTRQPMTVQSVSVWQASGANNLTE
jgi:hypothetical protein